MADSEQIYQEVLSDEQGKGVSPPVAEGRAKAARKRAEEGSPHPKEPKWWPGAQPHLEGGEEGGEAEAEAEEEVAEEPAAEEPAEEAPAAEAPAEEATADKQAPEQEQEQTPAAPAAGEQPADTAPTPAPAEQPAAAATQPAAAASAQPAEQPAATTGVSHGTATGTRLRPEDEVSTEAQFEGQKAMYERRKLIDELVATGVPAVTASDTDRPRSPWLAVLYLLIPLLVIFYLAGQEDQTAAEEEGGGATETTAPEEGGGEGGGLVLVAEGTAWEQDSLTLPADEAATVDVENADATVHNMSIYPDEDAATAKQDPLFTGPDVAGGATETYEIDPLKKNEYAFICDYHTNMLGTLTVE